MGKIIPFRKTDNGSVLRLVKNGERESDKRTIYWKDKTSDFRRQVFDILDDDDKGYLVQLAKKRALDYANDEYNYFRSDSGTVELNNPEEIIADIGDEITQTLFDRLLFSGRISDGDYDYAMYEREDEFDGLWLFKKLTGCKLKLWHNADAARRFVDNDVEHDPAYYGYGDDVEIEDMEDGDNRFRFAVPAMEILSATGKGAVAPEELERVVIEADGILNEDEKKEFLAFCDEYGKNVQIDNVTFFNENVFCSFLRNECIALEHKAYEKFFSFIDKRLGRENGKKARHQLKNLFALALYYKIAGHPVPIGYKKLGNYRLASPTE